MAMDLVNTFSLLSSEERFTLISDIRQSRMNRKGRVAKPKSLKKPKKDSFVMPDLTSPKKSTLKSFSKAKTKKDELALLEELKKLYL